MSTKRRTEPFMERTRFHRKGNAAGPLDEPLEAKFQIGVRFGSTHYAALEAEAKKVFGTSRQNLGAMVRLIVHDWWMRRRASRTSTGALPAPPRP